MLPICYPKREKSHEIHLALSQRIQYVLNKPSNKKQGKDLHWSETQYKSEGEDDRDNLSCHQTWEWKWQHCTEEKGAGYQYIIRLNQNNALQWIGTQSVV